MLGTSCAGSGGSGPSAATTTTANFTQPAVLGTVTVSFTSTSFMLANSSIIIENGGDYVVVAVVDGTHATIRNTGAVGNALPGAVIPSGSLVVPGGAPLVPGAANQVLTTDATGTITQWNFIRNVNVDPGAAIAGTKISPNFGTQNILTSGTLGAGATTVTSLTDSGLGLGVVHSDAGGLFSSSTIVNADVNAAAAIDGTKISPNFGAQNILTSGTLGAGATTVTSLNVSSGKITSLANGTADTDGVNLGQLKAQGRTARVTTVNHAASPYTILAADEILQCDSSTGTINLQLPNPANKAILTIADTGGVSSSNFITLVPFGAETIWALAGNFVLSFNKMTWTVWSDGTNWWVAGPL